MKLILRIILLVLITMVFSLAGKSQPHMLLQDFSGFQQDNQLILRWTFRGGSLCDGTRIERSEDGLRFSEVGEIPGICGSPDNAITFTFIDSFPLPNAINHYRLELGNYGFSTTLSLEFINSGESGFVVHTTTHGQTDILFQNISGRKGVAIFYSSAGKKLSEEEFSGQRLSLSQGRFPSGVYLLMLVFSDNTSLSGNFIVP